MDARLDNKGHNAKETRSGEMRFLRKRKRVPWTARRTNALVLQMARTARTPMTTIRQRQIGYLGLVLRSRNLKKTASSA